MNHINGEKSLRWAQYSIWVVIRPIGLPYMSSNEVTSNKLTGIIKVTSNILAEIYGVCTTVRH